MRLDASALQHYVKIQKEKYTFVHPSPHELQYIKCVKISFIKQSVTWTVYGFG